MKADRQRRNFWMASEIDMMLKLIEDVQRVYGCTSTTHSTFVDIANKMKKNGFANKSAMQIRRKWFQMKSAYLCYKRGNVERIQLIPDEFRDKVAQFVEAERKFCNVKMEKDMPNQLTKQTNKIQPETTLQKDYTPPEQQITIQVPKEDVNFQRQTNDDDDDSDDDDDNECNFEKQLEEFVNEAKQMQNVLVYDFRRMQERLLTYQAKCHKVRAAHVRAFFSMPNFDDNSTDIF